MGLVVTIIIHSKIFPGFWLVETTCIIHHTSCSWLNLKRIFVILNQWRQKVQPAACFRCMQIIEPLNQKTWGRDCVIFGERKKKERNGETPLRVAKYFEWMIKQLLNSGFVVYEEFCRSRKSVVHLGLRPLWITPSFICRILHILLSLIQ